MSIWKTFNDGHCAYCGVATRLYRPEDFPKHRSRKWLCEVCLRKLAIDVTKDKTTWGAIIYTRGS